MVGGPHAQSEQLHWALDRQIRATWFHPLD